MRTQQDIICDDELVRDVEEVMKNGSLEEKLETLDFLSSCFNKNVKLMKIFVEATRDTDNPIIKNKAQELFIKNMDRFIVQYINQQYPTFVKRHFEDMTQVAKMGIIIGLETYNPEIAKPTTYFVLYIKHEVSLYINQFVNGLSAYYANEKYKVKKAINRLETENREVNDMNIAEKTGLTTENVKQLRSMIASSTPVEFSEVYMNKEDTCDTPEQAVIKKEQEETIYNAIKKCLTEVEQQIISMHYGLDVGIFEGDLSSYPEKKAFRDISQTLDLPYDKVRKYHASALRKLHGMLSKSNVVTELSQAEKILDKENIPIIPAEQGNIIMQALESTDVDLTDLSF